MKIEFNISDKVKPKTYTCYELVDSAPCGIYKNTRSNFAGQIIKTGNGQVTYFDVENDQIYPFNPPVWEAHWFTLVQRVNKLTITVE